ncbi:RNA deprotection pyrophosphohydrolase [Gracilibacillus thailandensis]|uniref:Nucleoside triphosphatase YtkD n=1 Tax=Gracilibacillus thailandensis TaxID=563735 RepID=A0A6N7R0D9_9BACI|nr:nucleoside triphosphatase YtkD [Gracilibacillus thailandensis]MRI65639.1 nucleoside triphosphatase YtkD [Gracilibacillus thailandensis]
MKTFYDYYNNKIQLSFEDQPFDSDPKHVWVICRFEKKWLLTKHKNRGLEFPGGKVEQNETPKQAAIREVLEETGGEVDQIKYIGQYFVSGKREKLAKNIYFAMVKKLREQDSYYETEGPVLLEKLPENIKSNENYSFIMKDDVLSYSLDYIEKIMELTYS